MDLSRVFGTSATLEVEGVWKDIGDGGSIKVARQGNKAHEKVTRRLMSPHKAALRTGKMPDDVVEKIAIKAMSMAILLDWKGLDDNGVALPAYTPDEGVKMLTKYKDFCDTVSAMSADMASFQEEHEAAAGKNLQDSSSGS